MTVPSYSQDTPKIGSRLLVFMVIFQLSHVQDAAVFGCLCQHRGRILPVQHPASAHSQRENEMSETGPQPGCAPAAHHSFVSHSGASTAINQQPLLLLGVSPASWSPLSGNVRVGLGWLPSSCVPDVCHRRGMGRCLHRCLMPLGWLPMQDRDAATADSKLLCGDRSPAAPLRTLLQNSPRAQARDGGKQGHLLQLVLHPSSLPQHSQTLSHPHRLPQEILLFPGMFLSKIALIGLRKKKKWIKK